MILWPELSLNNLSAFEATLGVVRAIRTAAAIEYTQGEQMKLSLSVDKLEVRLGRQFELLGKDILAVDKAIQRMEDRLAVITGLRHDAGLIAALLINAGGSLEDEDEEGDD